MTAEEFANTQSRRGFLERTAGGMGMVALWHLLASEGRASNADDLCLIRSMYTEQINHHPGQIMMNCGSPFVGRPSMGAWVTYGLGSESQDLPGFVVLSSGGGTSAGSGNWSSGFLSSTFQ